MSRVVGSSYRVGYKVLGISIFFIIVLLAAMMMEYGLVHQITIRHNEEQAKLFSDQLNTSIRELIRDSIEGGGAIRGYVEKLNAVEGIHVRVVHSESVNREYESSPDQQARDNHERQALADGLSRFREEGDHFVRITPMAATSACSECHHLPDGSAVPEGYTLGLLTVSMEAVGYREATDRLLDVISVAIALTVALFALYGYNMYRISRTLQQANEEIQTKHKQLERAQGALARSQRLASVGTLSEGVAHEMLNPLNVMSATVQVMQLDPWPEETKQNLDEIMHQIDRATKIAGNLRSFAHQKENVIEPVRLVEVLDRTVAALEHDLARGGVSLDRAFDEDLPPIEADEEKLSQVFLNLLKNAIDAVQGKQEKKITMTAAPAEGSVEIRVSDNGEGIAEEYREKIFDPFFTTRDPDKGTGLGLSFVNAIVESHGGTIRVESAPGKGATFIVRLPVKGAAEGSSDASHLPEA